MCKWSTVFQKTLLHLEDQGKTISHRSVRMQTVTAENGSLGKKQVFLLMVSRENTIVSLINEFAEVEDRSGCILTLRRYTKPRAVDQWTKTFKINYLKLSFQIGSKFIFYEKLVWYVFSRNWILNECLVNLNILPFSSKKTEF